MADDLSPEAMPLVPMSSQPQAPAQPTLEPWSPPAAAPVAPEVAPMPVATEMFAAATAPLPPVETPPSAAPAQGWGVRETTLPPGVVPPPPMSGTPSAPWAPPSPPPAAVKKRGRLGILATVGVVALVLLVKFGLGFAAKDALTATNKTYHLPATISGDAQSSDPSMAQITDQMKQAYELPALQNAHTEAAAYADSSSHLVYMMAFGQDNAGRDEVRQNAGLTDQFPGITGVVNRSDGGINVSCGSVSATSGTFQGCTWYNDNAFGAFADYGSGSSPQQTATLLMTTLKAMVA